MADQISRWVIENAYLIPYFFGALILGAWLEKRRLDRRIDAVIALLKLRGIDILDDSVDYDDL